MRLELIQSKLNPLERLESQNGKIWFLYVCHLPLLYLGINFECHFLSFFKFFLLDKTTLFTEQSYHILLVKGETNTSNIIILVLIHRFKVIARPDPIIHIISNVLLEKRKQRKRVIFTFRIFFLRNEPDFICNLTL